jgi:hypothetical protein
LRAGSEPKEVAKKKKAMQEDEDYSDDEWPSSSDSSSGNLDSFFPLYWEFCRANPDPKDPYLLSLLDPDP